MIDEKETARIADEAATKAAKHVFAILGVDIDTPKEVEEFRENLRFAANMRRSANRWSLAIVASIGTGTAGALAVGLISLARGGGIAP